MSVFLFSRPSIEEIQSWGKSFDKLMRSTGQLSIATIIPNT